MGNQKRQLFVPGPPKFTNKRQLSVSFSCYPSSLTRFRAAELVTLRGLYKHMAKRPFGGADHTPPSPTARDKYRSAERLATLCS